MAASLRKCLIHIPKVFQVTNVNYGYRFGYNAYNSHKFVGAIREFHKTWILKDSGIKIRMPALSPTMSEGTVVKWYKKEGESFEAGDVLCDIQTDKAVVSVEADDEGVMAKVLVQENAKEVKVGVTIAITVEPGADWKNVEYSADDPEESAATESKTDAQPTKTTSSQTKLASAAPVPPPSSHQGDRNFGPSVLLLLQTYGIGASQVSPTGPHGKLLKADVLKYVLEKNLKPLDQAAAAPVGVVAAPQVMSQKGGKSGPPLLKSTGPLYGPSTYRDIEVTSMRRVIAKRLTESKKSIPHAYATAICNIDPIIAYRKHSVAKGSKISINDIVVKLVGMTLQRCPDMNVYWQKGQLIRSESVDISVAVATEGGLITPIIKDVPSRTVVNINQTMRELGEKARAGKLKPDEFMGGTFTISNLGMFGIQQFSAIINPPQCGILAVGAGLPVLSPDGNFNAYMATTLCYDGSAVGENVAAHFIQTLKSIMESPALALLPIFPPVLSVKSTYASL